jgi:hypothetical protein
MLSGAVGHALGGRPPPRLPQAGGRGTGRMPGRRWRSCLAWVKTDPGMACRAFGGANWLPAAGKVGRVIALGSGPIPGT